MGDFKSGTVVLEGQENSDLSSHALIVLESRPVVLGLGEVQMYGRIAANEDVWRRGRDLNPR
jgi:hypothetical protein